MLLPFPCKKRALCWCLKEEKNYEKEKSDEEDILVGRARVEPRLFVLVFAWFVSQGMVCAFSRQLLNEGFVVQNSSN